MGRADGRRPRTGSSHLFADTYGRGEAVAWFNRWRVFNLACAELFAFAGGDEWLVTHLRLTRP